jgi:murein DD-endopeptidase MepM/ murein hydrolase activator NlpD
MVGLWAQQPESDPLPADNRSQGPRDNRGVSQQSQELARQQYIITAQMDALSVSDDAQQAATAGGGSGRFGWPERYRTISQGFGCTTLRMAPASLACPSGHFHTGDDIAGPNQTDVLAADTGVIRTFRGATGYGNYAIVTHGNGYATLYGHLHDFSVPDGQLVQRGNLIAHEGTTGNSTGPHLHFEVRQGGGYLDLCPYLEDCVKAA